MFKKKGVALKTFLFTSGIITFAVVISLAVLYVILPDYYYYTKKDKLYNETDLLINKLAAAGSMDECLDLFNQFSINNNAMIMWISDDEIYNMQFFSITSSASESEIFNTKIGVSGKTSLIIGREEINPTERNYDVLLSTSPNTLEAIVIEKDIYNDFIDRIVITSTLQPISEAGGVILSLTPFLLGVDIIVALIAAYFYSKRFTRSIIKMSEAAADMRQMIPGTVSNIKTNDELGELSQNLDSMYTQLCENITKLQYAMESKADFMRAASHELKTPIAALNGIVEGMIDNIGVYKNKDKYLSESKKLIDKLAYLVNEILEASTQDSMDSHIAAEPVDISDVVRTAVSNHKLLIEEKELNLTTDNFSFILYTDDNLLLTAISNIISNAVKYTDKSGAISITFLDNRLIIENQCEQIPHSELPKLFEPFFTLNYSRNREKSGTGLGLYIVKKILERLRIPYEIESTDTRFRFILTF